MFHRHPGWSWKLRGSVFPRKGQLAIESKNSLLDTAQAVPVLSERVGIRIASSKKKLNSIMYQGDLGQGFQAGNAVGICTFYKSVDRSGNRLNHDH